MPVDRGKISMERLSRLVDSANSIVSKIVVLGAEMRKEFTTEGGNGKGLGDLPVDDRMRDLSRFWNLFKNIYEYSVELRQYYKDMSSGMFNQLAIEMIFSDQKGLGLICETLYLYGVMLLLLDVKIGGDVRERVFSSCISNLDESELESANEICLLCADSGFSGNSVSNPSGYPENYFLRNPLSNRVVSRIVCSLCSEDIYSRRVVYPLLEHRAVALARQASMLCICLFFKSEILDDFHAMRDICHKYFSDNWVVNWYLGFNFDLMEVWRGHTAAMGALRWIFGPENVSDLKQLHVRKISAAVDKIKSFSGCDDDDSPNLFTEDFMYENIDSILSLLRDSNVSFRWLILHQQYSTVPELRKALHDVDRGKLINFFLIMSHFELKLKNALERLLTSRRSNWNRYKTIVRDRINELSKYYFTESVLDGMAVERKTEDFPANLIGLIDSLDYEDARFLCRAQELFISLENFGKYCKLNQKVETEYLFGSTCILVKNMLNMTRIDRDIISTFHEITNCSYLSEMILELIGPLRTVVQKGSLPFSKIKSLSLKLATTIRGLIGVSKESIPIELYYSKRICRFLRLLMYVVFEALFDSLCNEFGTDSSSLQTASEQATLVNRYNLSEIIGKMSVWVRDVLRCDKFFIGTTEMDFWNIHVECIRKITLNGVKRVLGEGLDAITHQHHHSPSDFDYKLLRIAKSLQRFKKIFFYIKDFINMKNDVLLWHEVLLHAMGLETESMECGEEWDDATADFHELALGSGRKDGFIEKIVQALFLEVNSSSIVYLTHSSTWYDSNVNKDVISYRSFRALLCTIGVRGMIGIDRIVYKTIKTHLKAVYEDMRAIMEAKKDELSRIVESLSDRADPSQRRQRLMDIRSEQCTVRLLNCIGIIGQMQLIRSHICTTLNIATKTDSPLLYNSMKVLNDCLTDQIYEMPQNHPLLLPSSSPSLLNVDAASPSSSAPKDLIHELITYSERMGIYEPLEQQFCSEDPPSPSTFLLAFLTTSYLSDVAYNKPLSILVSKNTKKSTAPFAAGISTLLHQFNVEHITQYFSYLERLIKSLSLDNGVISKSKGDLLSSSPLEYSNIQLFFTELSKYSRISKVLIGRLVDLRA